MTTDIRAHVVGCAATGWRAEPGYQTGRRRPATAHMQALARAGLVTCKRIGQWTFYKRDEAALAALKQKIAEEL